MKEKTSITLSHDVLVQLDRLVGSKTSRSALIEQVLREYLRQRTRAALDASELEAINAAADQLNAEVLDALDYQAPDEP